MRACKQALLATAILFAASPASAQGEELTLARALRLAKQRAPEMKAAQAGVAAADAAVDVASSTYYPTLNVQGRGDQIAFGENAGIIPPRTTPVNIVTYTTAVTALANLHWRLLDFGRTSHAVRSAEAAREASAASAADVEAKVIEVVTNGYLDVVYGEKARDIQKSIVEDREKLISIVKGLAKQGLVPAVEELRAQSRLEAARRDLEVSEAALIEAKVGLLGFLGVENKASFTAPRLPRVRIDASTAAQDSETKKPAVAAARATKEAGEQAAAAAHAHFYPTVDVQGTASYRSAHIDVFDGWIPTRTASGTVLITLPIFEPLTWASSDAAKAQAARAEASYEQSKRDARTTALQALQAMHTSERVTEHAKKAAETSTGVLTVMRARYQQGLASTIDLIDAETSDAEAKLATVRAERNADGATVRLLAAVGKTSKLTD